MDPDSQNFSENKRTQIKNVLLLISVPLLCLYAYFVIGPFLYRVPQADENLIVYELWRTSQGSIPYRDFFDFIWPGTYYLGLLIVKLFGGLSLVALRSSVLLLLALQGAVVYRIARAYMPWRWVVFLMGFFWITHFPVSVQFQHHILSSSFAMVATLFMWRYVRPEFKNNKKDLILSGLFTSITAIFLQTIGFLIFGAWVLFLFFYESKKVKSSALEVTKYGVLNFVLPFLMPIGVMLTYFYSQGALSDFIYSTFTWVLHGGYSATNSIFFLEELFILVVGFNDVAFHKFEDHLRLGIDLLLIILPALGISWGLTQVVKSVMAFKEKTEISAHTWEYVFLTVTAVAMLLATLSYPSIFHIKCNGWVAFIMGVGVAYPFIKKYPRLETTLLTIFFTYLASYFLMYFYTSVVMRERPMVLSHGTVEQHLYTSVSESDELIEAKNTIVKIVTDNTRPDEPFFVFTASPEFYLLTDRRNPTRFQLMMTLLDTPEQLKEIARDIKKAKPKFILYDRADQLMFQNDLRFKKLRNFDFEITDITSIVKRHYTPVYEYQRYYLYMRNDLNMMRTPSSSH